MASPCRPQAPGFGPALALGASAALAAGDEEAADGAGAGQVGEAVKPSSLGASPIGSVTLTTTTPSSTLDLTLPETGSYALQISPTGLDLGTINAQVRSTATGVLAVDGSTAISLGAGQNGRFTFTAQAGKGYGLALTGLTFTPSGGTLQAFLRKADGTFLTNCPFSRSGSCDLDPANFPTAGTYLLDFDPAGVNVASFSAVLSTDTGGTLTIGGATTAVTIARAGQNARYSFSGTAGQMVSVVIAASTLDDGNMATNNTTNVSVFKPSSPNFSPIGTGSFPTIATGTTVTMTLPETGSYTVLVSPVGLDSGSFNLRAE